MATVESECHRKFRHQNKEKGSAQYGGGEFLFLEKLFERQEFVEYSAKNKQNFAHFFPSPFDSNFDYYEGPKEEFSFSHSRISSTAVWQSKLLNIVTKKAF